MSDNNIILQDDQETETISLTDFATDDGGSTAQDHQNPPPSATTEDFFEFFRGGLTDNSDDKTMSHAEDIILCGRLVPMNHQSHHNKPHNQPVVCRRSRSESTATTTTTISPPVRTSHSLDYKRLNRNSSMSSEPAENINREGSVKKYYSSRWYVLLFGLVKVPPSEMDIRDIKSRQVRRSGSKTATFGPSESFKVVPVSRSVDHRKCSWRVLGFLSCKSSSSADVTAPVGCIHKV